MISDKKELAEWKMRLATVTAECRDSNEQQRHEKSGTPKRAAENQIKLGTSQKKELLPLLCVPVGVDGREVVPLFGEIFERENSSYRANGYAGAAIDAFSRMDIELRLRLESRFVLARMDTIHWTDIHASSVFCADARLGNHVSH
jgi:hypothetical protein